MTGSVDKEVFAVQYTYSREILADDRTFIQYGSIFGAPPNDMSVLYLPSVLESLALALTTSYLSGSLYCPHNALSMKMSICLGHRVLDSMSKEPWSTMNTFSNSYARLQRFRTSSLAM